jgi:hypothetical protein
MSLVTDVFLSKREALAALSASLQLPVRDTESAEPWLLLETGVALHIEVPKFGEDLPLTLDLMGEDQVRLESVASHLIFLVRDGLGWSANRLG